MNNVKRTGERVLGIIGLVIFMIGALLFVALEVAENQGFFEEIAVEMTNENSDLLAEQGVAPLTEQEANEFLEVVSSLNFTMFALVAFIAAVAGIVAVVIIKNKPVIASILFLGSTILYAALAFITLIFVGPLIPMLLYIIAGIMALVRKPKQVDPV
ncbi:hypothetical protein JCM19046_1350 [Bacillus sp. JCM 19046]|uniref:DUF4064 domain-containing protein n=1 Tax=Shouchella xiaoxiensis TaxID=766895 RepID=A0ABS2SYH6_9BACI|nr:DUF4064 domain-containing protein [Shouchella xiaoxiensis]MBM7840568.1 hypothetical protein [Shouchella xiaoxiensis]GAF12718.1 hypothetical protein JCM19045_1927 [Bacillus sp. JCM 19045]GAF16886.1 hypothetical protein JCM19046_1350 [Bacillus sp. JCM 19046]